MPKLLTCVALIAAAQTAAATTLIPADLGELSRDAIAIARGRVVSVDARWTEDRRTIETLVTLEVANYLKGDLGSTLQFHVPGGQLGRFRSIVVGAPEFTEDEQVIVFLGARGPSIPHLVGFSQGVYRVVPAAGNAGWIVTPPALLPSTSGTRAIMRGDPARTPLALAEFEQRVRALAGGAR
jgi:hypothetical protein